MDKGGWVQDVKISLECRAGWKGDVFSLVLDNYFILVNIATGLERKIVLVSSGVLEY